MRDVDQHETEGVNYKESGEAVDYVCGDGGVVSSWHLEQACNYPEAEAHRDPVVETDFLGNVSVDHHQNDNATHGRHYNFRHEVPTANITEQTHDISADIHYNREVVHIL